MRIRAQNVARSRRLVRATRLLHDSDDLAQAQHVSGNPARTRRRFSCCRLGKRVRPGVSLDAACTTLGDPMPMPHCAHVLELLLETHVSLGLRFADRHGVDERLGSKPREGTDAEHSKTLEGGDAEAQA